MKYCLIVLFSCVGLVAAGQSTDEALNKPNNWRTMMGYSMYGGGNITGITVMNEYNRYITPHIRIAPNFKFSSANRVTNFPSLGPNQEPSFLSQQAAIFELGAMGYYEYLNPNKSGLELGFGLFYRNFQWITTTGPYTEYFGTNNIRVPENSIAEYSENTFGFNVSIGFIIRISEVVNFNVTGIVQSDTGDNTGFGGFGGLSIKF